MLSRRQFSLTGVAAGALAAVPASADDRAVIDARINLALSKMYRQIPITRAVSQQARAMLVMPEVVKGRLIVGGSYGEGGLLLNDPARGYDRATEYYSVAAASIGLQAGVQTSSHVLMFMVDAALATFRNADGWEVGADAEVTFPDAGLKAEVNSTLLEKPIIGYVFGQDGFLAGVSLEGANTRGSCVSPIDNQASLLARGFPQPQLGDHQAARAPKRPYGHSFATGEVLKSAPTHGFHMHEDILGLAEHIDKAKALLLVEPLDPGRLQWARLRFLPEELGRPGILGKTRRPILDRCYRFVDLQQFLRLHAARSRDRDKSNFGSLTQSNTSKCSNTGRVYHDVGAAVLWHDKAITLDRIVPLDVPFQGKLASLSVLQHSTPILRRTIVDNTLFTKC